MSEETHNDTSGSGNSNENSDEGAPIQHIDFPIVAVGASAGGLEACEELFSVVESDIGVSFVVVVHLDPSHASLMSELLQKKSKLPVQQVTDGTAIELNHIYIIPPNKEMHIQQGKLYLTKLKEPRGLHLPIDLFFRSLAKDQGTNAIAIVLSGTGSDGTLGVKSIKEACGMVMVQSPATAKYEGMPHSAAATGLADFLLPAKDMPKQLASYAKFGRKLPESRINVEQSNTIIAIQSILSIILSQTGKDFSQYKKSTIIRRIERRMNLHQMVHIDDYLIYLQSSRQEVGILFKELLIGVTNFFRDTQAFNALQMEALPALLINKPEGYVIRVWVPGCSTGEEAYSIAIVLVEIIEQMNRHFSVQVFATDIDEVAIDKARSALFPSSIEVDVSEARLARFFEKQDSGQYRVRKSIRDMLIFAPQNLIEDPPFTKLDLLSCRNLLIYFGAELQKKLLPLFYYSIKPGGLLFLGSSESLGQSAELFTPVNKKWKLFAREEFSPTTSLSVLPYAQTTIPALPDTRVVEKLTVEVSAMELVEAILSETDTPPSVIVDDDNNIIYIHGRTGQFLEPAQGQPSSNILTMVRTGLKAELALAIHKVRSSQTTQVVRNLQVDEQNASVCVDLTVKPILNQSAFAGLKMIVFNEQPESSEKSLVTATDALPPVEAAKMTTREQALARELSHVRESLQTTIEELETANEELRSTNEELQSTNEELQSTNEEMETSKEELQSLNEESATVNAELQSRIDQLSAANDDMKNLLDSTDIATIFLDTELCVRRFTPRTSNIIPLVAIDAGRPIKHFASNLVDVNLVDLAQQVLENLAVKEQEVYNSDGSVYQMRIRPYRTIGNVIDGVVITFEDISVLKATQLKMHENAQLFLTLSDFTPVGLFHADLSGRPRLVNPRWCEITGWEQQQALHLEHILNFQSDDAPRVSEAWQNTVNESKAFNESYSFIGTSGEAFKVNVQATTVLDEQGRPMSVVGTLRVE